MSFMPWPLFGRLLRRGFGSGGGGIGTTYLLLDQFNTARAAGSVNGTPAEPTGQTRTVTDTNSKLSIAGGLLTFATGGVGIGNPGLWYPTMTTVAGRAFVGQITQSASGVGSMGWDGDQTGAITDAIRIVSGTLVGVIAGGVAITIGASTAATTYTITITQRAGGFWFFMKGGTEFPSQTLVWISTTGAPQARFPAVAVQSGTIAVFTADNIRVPTTLYIPQPLAYDTFTRANGALGSTETIGPDAQVLAALAWAFTVGIWAIVTNKAVGTPTLGADVIVNGGFNADTDWNKGAGWTIAAGLLTAAAATSQTIATVAPLVNGRWYRVVFTVSGFVGGTVKCIVGSNNLTAQAANGTYTEVSRAGGTGFNINGTAFTGSVDNVSAKLLTTAELFSSVAVSTADVIADVAITLGSPTVFFPVGLVLNLDSTSNPQNFIIAYLQGNGFLLLDEYVAGVGTNKIFAAVTYSAGAVLRVVRDGTSCRVFYNNAAVSTVQTMTANVNKNHGLFSTDVSNSFDNFTLWPRGTSNEYGGLDQY